MTIIEMMMEKRSKKRENIGSQHDTLVENRVKLIKERKKMRNQNLILGICITQPNLALLCCVVFIIGRQSQCSTAFFDTSTNIY